MKYKNKNYKMSYSGVLYIDEKSEQIGSFIPKAKNGNVFSQQLKRYEINMQSVVIRNDIPVEFDETMQFSPDFDLFMKISSKYNVCVINKHLVKYRKLHNSLSSKKMHRWWIETKQTLDNICESNLELKITYKNESKIAYAKVSYYKARYLMKINEHKKAIKELFECKSVNITYFFLFLLSLTPKRVWDFIHEYK